VFHFTREDCRIELKAANDSNLGFHGGVTAPSCKHII